VRRFPVLLALVAIMPACTGSDPEPLDAPPVPGEYRRSIETAAIRATVIDFLEAYARSGAGVEPLAEVVGSPDLRNWAYWLGVQNTGLDLVHGGEVEVRAIQVLQVTDRTAAVAVDATVTLLLESEDGEIAPSPRIFQSPFVLARTGPDPGSWVVVDAIRDGRSMQSSILLLRPPPEARGAGTEIEVDSFFQFSAGTVANLRVRNATREPLRVVPSRSLVQVGQRVLRGAAVTATFADPLAPGATVEGAINFPVMAPGDLPLALRVAMQGRTSRTVLVEIPPEAYGSGV
jgi:hypothetical protein